MLDFSLEVDQQVLTCRAVPSRELGGGGSCPLEIRQSDYSALISVFCVPQK